MQDSERKKIFKCHNESDGNVEFSLESDTVEGAAIEALIELGYGLSWDYEDEEEESYIPHEKQDIAGVK